MQDEKRLFFAADVIGIWPRKFPPARILDEDNRHITLAFLGSTSLSQLLEKMKTLPTPSFDLGLGGTCTRWIFLPNEKEARVIAANVAWLSEHASLEEFQAHLAQWLKSQGYMKKETRPFFPHITVARGSFDVEAWKNFNCQIPFYISCIALFESLGNSQYKSLWRYPFILPFEEIEHTADIAFLIRGRNFQDLGLHAQLALAFKFPPLISYLKEG